MICSQRTIRGKPTKQQVHKIKLVLSLSTSTRDGSGIWLIGSPHPLKRRLQKDHFDRGGNFFQGYGARRPMIFIVPSLQTSEQPLESLYKTGKLANRAPGSNHSTLQLLFQSCSKTCCAAANGRSDVQTRGKHRIHPCICRTGVLWSRPGNFSLLVGDNDRPIPMHNAPVAVMQI